MARGSCWIIGDGRMHILLSHSFSVTVDNTAFYTEKERHSIEQLFYFQFLPIVFTIPLQHPILAF